MEVGLKFVLRSSDCNGKRNKALHVNFIASYTYYYIEKLHTVYLKLYKPKL